MRMDNIIVRILLFVLAKICAQSNWPEILLIIIDSVPKSFNYYEIKYNCQTINTFRIWCSLGAHHSIDPNLNIADRIVHFTVSPLSEYLVAQNKNTYIIMYLRIG